jgi:hypothetical protein
MGIYMGKYCDLGKIGLEVVIGFQHPPIIKSGF